MVWLFSGAEKNHLSPFPVEKFKMTAIILLYFYHVFFHVFPFQILLHSYSFLVLKNKTPVYLTTGVAHMPLPDTIFRKYF